MEPTMTDIPTHPIQPEPDAEVQQAPFIDPQPQPPPVVDAEQPTRGVKRKLAGWTAPADYSVGAYPPPPSPSQSQSYYHAQPQTHQIIPANPEPNIPAAPFPPPPQQQQQQQQESNNEHDIKPTIPSLSPSPSPAAAPAPVPETTIKSEPSLPPVHTFASLAATSNPTPTSTTAVPPPQPQQQTQPQQQPQQQQQQHRPAPQPAKHAAAARMGTRLPGSGDLGGSGPRKRLGWPRMGGVRVDASWKGRRRRRGRGLQGKEEDEEEEEDDDDEEEVLEEECYAWTDLPMNKQGKSLPFPPPAPCRIPASPSPREKHTYHHLLPLPLPLPPLTLDDNHRLPIHPMRTISLPRHRYNSNNNRNLPASPVPSFQPSYTSHVHAFWKIRRYDVLPTCRLVNYQPHDRLTTTAAAATSPSRLSRPINLPQDIPLGSHLHRRKGLPQRARQRRCPSGGRMVFRVSCIEGWGRGEEWWAGGWWNWCAG